MHMELERRRDSVLLVTGVRLLHGVAAGGRRRPLVEFFIGKALSRPSPQWTTSLKLVFVQEIAVLGIYSKARGL